VQRANFKVVIDACVLANARVSDVLLTFAEFPSLYLPRWSEAILVETQRVHLEKLGWPKKIADNFQASLRSAFPEALISGYEHRIEHCFNDPKDRHVLACAIHSQSELILTFNQRDFPAEALSKWQISANHPQDYLLALHSMDPAIVVHKLNGICHRRNTELEDYLLHLGRWLPAFSQKLLNDIGST